MKKVEKDNEALLLQKKLLKKNKKEIICKINLMCAYVFVLSICMDLIKRAISFGLNTSILVGFMFLLVFSVIWIRKVIQYRKQNRNSILKNYINESFKSN